MWECNLIDLHDIPEMEPEQQLQDTYQRGKKQWIDFILGTPWNQMCVQWWGTLEYNDSIMSDHRGQYVNLDTELLFGGTTDDQVASCQTIVDSMSIWTQSYFLEAPQMTK
jgi:hypothetical protein